jgi:hypothetical protein
VSIHDDSRSTNRANFTIDLASHGQDLGRDCSNYLLLRQAIKQ